MPYACIGIYKYLLALRPSRKLTSEAREGLAPGRDQGIHETYSGELPGCKLSLYENK